MRTFLTVAAAAAIALSAQGCYKMRGSSGGGQTSFEQPRKIDAKDIALPAGYRIEAVAQGLTFPTGVAFDNRGGVYVVEAGYSYGEVWTTPRLLKIGPDGKSSVIVEGGKNGPWTGVAFHDNNFYVAEGGQLEGGRILKITPDGQAAALIDRLPSMGDHHTNGPAPGPDGKIYFTQGVATNSAVVGEDNFRFGWLKRHPAFHDKPCQDVTLTGRNYETENILKPGSKEKVTTGAFSPFGTMTAPNQIVKGSLPCNGAIMRIDAEGGRPELVAWGFRNPFGIAFSPDKKLYVTDNMYDVRGSRPVFGAGDLMWEVNEGVWYGWPDFHGDHPLSEGDLYKPPADPKPEPLLSKYPNRPPRPVAILPVHSSSGGFDFSRSDEFGFKGQAFVAQFGDEAPVTGKVLGPVGFKVVRVDPATGSVEEFAVNKGKTNGPASYLKTGGLERPVAARFTPDGRSLYVVDFGVMIHDEEGAKPKASSGVLWKISKESVIARPAGTVR